MFYILKTEDDAKKILEIFNSFHDGFIKTIRLQSYDRFNPNKEQFCTGNFNVYIDFAHYNYEEGKKPYNQIIHATFKRVGNFNCALEEIKNCDWTIYAINFEKAKRIVQEDIYEQCFVFKLILGYFNVENNSWSNIEKKLFTFIEAKFQEK